MKLTLRILFAVAALAVVSFNSSAQTYNYREKGYKGSFSLTDHYGVFAGIETSHGYMFDSHNYLGAGIGGFVFPNSSHPTFMDAFLDYQNYLRDKSSTPVLGIKTGLMHAFNYDENFNIKICNAVFVEPNVGWSWGLKSGKGLTLGLGATMVIPVDDSRADKRILPMPKLSFGFEF